MARNKRSTALFEVIHTAKKPPKGSPSQSIPTPRWWQKDKKPIVAMPDPAPQVGETAGRQSSWLNAFRKPAGETEQTHPESSTAGEWDPTASPIRRPVVPATVEEPATVFWIPDATPASGSFSESSASTDSHPAVESSTVELSTDAPTIESQSAVEVDPPLVAEVKERFADRVKRGATTPAGGAMKPPGAIKPVAPAEPPVVQKSTSVRRQPDGRASGRAVQSTGTGEINLTVSYWGVMAVAMIMVVVVVLAYAAGSHRGESASETKNESPSHGVSLSVVGPAKPVETAAPLVAPKTGGTVAGPKVAPVEKPAKTSDDAIRHDVLEELPKRSSPAIGAARVVGKRYFVIQSYPERELPEARKIADAFNRGGVPCSLVKLVNTGYAPDGWYSLVGLEEMPADDSAGKITEYNRRVNSLYAAVAPRAPKPVKQWIYPWQGQAE